MVEYSIGGLCAGNLSVNDSGVLNKSTAKNITPDKNITVSEKTTNQSGPINYSAYPLNCPKWDDYKSLHTSPIRNFGDYLFDLKNYVSNYTAMDDYNIQKSKENYENNSGYFSGNPTYGDYDYRYMPTSELNKAYFAGYVAKSRITLPDALSTKLQAQYTMASVVLGTLSGICGVCSAVAGLLTAGTAGGASPILVVFTVFTGVIVATTIAVGTCSAVVAHRSASITVEKSKIDNRLYLMNAELMYRATLPNQENPVTSANNPAAVENNTSLHESNNTTLNNTTVTNETAQNITDVVEEEITDNTNNTEDVPAGNVYGVNDVPPSQKPVPGDLKVNSSGTFMDEIDDVDISGFPEKPVKPKAKWYQFGVWIKYGFKYVEWTGNVTSWGFKHMDSMNTMVSLSKKIQTESKNC